MFILISGKEVVVKRSLERSKEKEEEEGERGL